MMNRKMKKAFALILLRALLALAGCGQAAPAPAAESATPAPAAESAAPAPAEPSEAPAPAETETPAPTESETPAPATESAAPSETPAAQESGFAYEHDPRDNPEAMKDIIVNPEAVYGFSPDPDSTRLGTYAQYDWTDPDLVAKAKEDRIAYHESLDTMTDILYKMRDEGATTEEMARAVSAERNRLRLAAYDNDPEGLAEVKKSNLETYGHEDGPTADEMYEKYGSWETVIQKSFSPNLGMDACCGLYDEYYPLYIELGLAQP